MENYETVVGALSGLQSRGFTIDFNLAFDQLICSNQQIRLQPGEFEITEMYRFEGDTNPDDEDIVYAIVSKDGHIKGTLTSAYGMYAESLSTEMLEKLRFHS